MFKSILKARCSFEPNLPELVCPTNQRLYIQAQSLVLRAQEETVTQFPKGQASSKPTQEGEEIELIRK